MAPTVISQKASVLKAAPKMQMPKRAVAKAQPPKSLAREKLMAAVTVTAATALSHPLAAEASVTPSLKNLLTSVVAGGVVLGGLLGAVSLVARFDPVNRK